ncbi:MAG TPA: AAA family ATPase [Gemmatimonadaceae bacterium]|nr:AAA family ATPase [Gemmatimonadaceae bacterium]
MEDLLKDLELLVRSRYSLIVLETSEEERAASVLESLAVRLTIPYFTWSRSKGLRRAGLANEVYKTQDPTLALAHIEASGIAALYHLRDFSPLLQDATLASKLKDAAAQLVNRKGAIVLTGCSIELPETLRATSTTVRLPLPTVADYATLLQRTLRDLADRSTVEIRMSREDTDSLIANLKGLSLEEASRILTKAIIEDGRLTSEDIAHVIDAKKAVIEREGILEYFPADERMADIAGLDGLKSWLTKRRAIIADPKRATDFGLSFPRGVLLLGVPGCGKSLCAKAIAKEWSLPLLRLDPGKLYDKYIGESERNFRRAITVAERMAPLILWIDEIEKAFAAGGEGDGGTSMRILGSFLSWLQERRGDVFVVATANDVTRLPPELLRKGRFDEIFFVDLPTVAERCAIFEIHLRKRSQQPTNFNLGALAAATGGFSGAEIEQVIVSALYSAFSAKSALSTQLLLAEISMTKPLSVTMGERFEAMREWAKEKTVLAN